MMSERVPSSKYEVAPGLFIGSEIGDIDREAAARLANSEARELALEAKLAKTRDFLDDLWNTQSYDARELHDLLKELDEPETPTSCRYSIEPHGDNYTLYYDRCDHRHGYALADISEPAWNCDLRHLELLLNLGAAAYRKNPTGGHLAE